MNKFPLPQT